MCWGDNFSRAAGAVDDVLVPTALGVAGTVLDGVAVTELASGVFGNCALGASKQPGCWGILNVRGDGGLTFTATPATVALTYGPPVTAPTITSVTGGEEQIQITWDGPTDDGGAAITQALVRQYDGATLVETFEVGTPPDGSGDYVFTTSPGTYQLTVAAKNVEGEGPESALSSSVVVTSAGPSDEPYTAITPCRILDTRVAGGRLIDREIRDVRVTGSGAALAAQGGLAGGCGIPDGATAVEASITAVDPLDSGFFRAWPAGESMPNATFMNFDRGMDITNTGSVTIALDVASEASELRIRNFGGASHYVIDIQGYFGGTRAMRPSAGSPAATTSAAPSEASEYQAITPCRILDTRQAKGPLADREIRTVTVIGDGPQFAAQGGLAGGCAIPATAVAVEASVTAVDPLDSGFFRAYPANQSMPNATFMNFDRGMDITNTGAITIDPNDETDHLKIRNFGGTSHYVIDIQGFYLAEPNISASVEATTSALSAGQATYVGITPCRIVDTRKGSGPLVDREIRNIRVLSGGQVFDEQGGTSNGCEIPSDAVAVEASVTAVDPLDSGFFRAWPNGESMPNATFMNFDRGMDITNTGAITVNPDSSDDLQLRIRNFGGTSHYVIDIQGYFLPRIR